MNNIGSIWNKWDLHFHTPSSFDYKNGSITNEDIVTSLISNNLRLIAVTDHNSIDRKRINDLRTIAGNNLTILPGIEVRTGCGTGENIHIIGIFPEDVDIDKINRDFLSKGGIDDQRAKKRNDEEIYVNIDTAVDIIHSNNGIVSIHAGKKSNGIEIITNALPTSSAIKQDIAEKVDIFEMGNIKDISDYQKYVFPSIGFSRPMIICSDNHNINNYFIKSPLWVKAEPTFDGLKQVLVEYEDRIFIGDKPEKLRDLQDNKNKYIKSLSISPQDEKTGDFGWFENINVEFNPGLISIIGNKGSGKSALADIISLAGNSKCNEKDYSFLNNKKFKEIKTGKAKYFNAELIWQDGTSSNKINLATTANFSNIEKIKYVPQSYIETLCNEVEGKTFQDELKNVIFSRIPESERLGTTNFNELITTKTEGILSLKNLKLNKMEVINKQIIDIEEQLSQTNEQIILSKLEDKKQELKNLEKPEEIKAPNNSQEDEEIKKSIQIQKDASEKKKKEIDDGKILLTELALRKHNISCLKSKLDVINQELISLRETYNLSSLELPEDIFSLTIRQNIFDEKLHNIDNAIEQQKIAEAKKLEEIEQLNNQIKNNEDKLDEPNKKYQKYLNDLKLYNDKYLEISGNRENPRPGTINYYEKQLEYIRNELPKVYQNIQNDRDILLDGIIDDLVKLKNVYEELFSPLKELIQKPEINNLNLSFSAELMPVNFINDFLAYINQGVSGSFKGKEDGKEVLNNILKTYDFNSKDSIKAFVSNIMHLLGDYNNITNQLSKNKTKNDIYNYLWQCKYIKPKYSLLANNKELSFLSPGERGIVLLIFYLLLDPSNRPIVIDQPEENLDNFTISKNLVPLIKQAKKKRQIFMVTHNPNIAVVCDAEQIIHANIDKEHNNKITYTYGAIETPEINELIAEVLEGTITSFDIRNDKYFMNRKNK